MGELTHLNWESTLEASERSLEVLQVLHGADDWVEDGSQSVVVEVERLQELQAVVLSGESSSQSLTGKVQLDDETSAVAHDTFPVAVVGRHTPAGCVLPLIAAIRVIDGHEGIFFSSTSKRAEQEH